MPAPRVFISSTCYDLKHIRENLKFFVRNLGYEPVLSEEGGIFYDPRMHAHEACVTEVPACQVLVLIIGGRYGSPYLESDSSVTNEEYKSAVNAKIPIFALVERGVLDDYRVYKANAQNGRVDAAAIKYPAADSPKIFDFIDEVQSQTVNNALVPFSDFEEMQKYLRQQWASMLHRFLTTEGEARRTADILEALAKANERIEFITRRIVDSVGTSFAKATVELYDILLKTDVSHDFHLWGVPMSPKKVLERATMVEFCDKHISIDPHEEGITIQGGGPPYTLSQKKYDSDSREYEALRKKLFEALEKRGVTAEAYLKSNEA
jgi:hypothetical protein